MTEIEEGSKDARVEQLEAALSEQALALAALRIRVADSEEQAIALGKANWQITQVKRAAECERDAFKDALQHERSLNDAVADRAANSENTLRAIAELPEPRPNKNSALNQCAYLKDVAQSALYIAALSSEDATRPTGDKE